MTKTLDRVKIEHPEKERLMKLLGCANETSFLISMAKHIGVKYRNMEHLFELAPKLFDLASISYKHLCSVNTMTIAKHGHDSQLVDTYVQIEIDRSSPEAQIDSMIKAVENQFKKNNSKKLRTPKHIQDTEWYTPPDQ